MKKTGSRKISLDCPFKHCQYSHKNQIFLGDLLYTYTLDTVHCMTYRNITVVVLCIIHKKWFCKVLKTYPSMYGNYSMLILQAEDQNWPRRKKSDLMVGKIIVPEYQLPGYRYSSRVSATRIQV